MCTIIIWLFIGARVVIVFLLNFKIKLNKSKTVISFHLALLTSTITWIMVTKWCNKISKSNNFQNHYSVYYRQNLSYQPAKDQVH